MGLFWVSLVAVSFLFVMWQVFREGTVVGRNVCFLRMQPEKPSAQNAFVTKLLTNERRACRVSLDSKFKGSS